MDTYLIHCQKVVTDAERIFKPRSLPNSQPVILTDKISFEVGQLHIFVIHTILVLSFAHLFGKHFINKLVDVISRELSVWISGYTINKAFQDISPFGGFVGPNKDHNVRDLVSNPWSAQLRSGGILSQ